MTAARDPVSLDPPAAPEVALHSTSLRKGQAHRFDIILQLVGAQRGRLPFEAELTTARVKHRIGRDEPVAVTIAGGGRVAQLPVSSSMDAFALQRVIRKGLEMTDAKRGARIAIDLRRMPHKRKVLVNAAYGALVWLAPMPVISGRRDLNPGGAGAVELFGAAGRHFMEQAAHAAAANVLTRWLCTQPGNILDPDAFVAYARHRAQAHALDFEHTSCAELAAKGAGAFAAVAGKAGRGGLVHLRYRCGQRRAKRYAFVGKGVCYDTGGLNLKPHRSMLGMHADMAGAAAALATVIAAKEMRAAIDVDAWLAIAENVVSPEAMKPGDIVTAANGTTIELVHTDAEGRLLLADALHYATKERVDAAITLATLTGSMAVALGTRIGGVAGDPRLVESAIAASHLSGERLHAFPLPADYRDQLESKVADIAQCAVSSEADHILAALFLKEFAGKAPWLHLDLSSSANKDGLGAVPTDLTGFGASWAVHWLIDHARH
ncbi:MAG: leucyl aminopeptidase family protein [Betaproteobacteria bacterium AqS2]|uniref:Leucyl aminopeptidase family protein n=1 Tax=Candidatus Amphirhobacter heronislandensis TaxID=1732024 RepID=A0A930XX82_9GAMM|nr:leucyl aminopeptidase family protein [Betaproteobacteria bacterium AqS2]